MRGNALNTKRNSRGRDGGSIPKQGTELVGLENGKLVYPYREFRPGPEGSF